MLITSTTLASIPWCYSTCSTMHLFVFFIIHFPQCNVHYMQIRPVFLCYSKFSRVNTQPVNSHRSNHEWMNGYSQNWQKVIRRIISLLIKRLYNMPWETDSYFKHKIMLYWASMLDPGHIPSEWNDTDYRGCCLEWPFSPFCALIPVQTSASWNAPDLMFWKIDSPLNPTH